MYCMAVEKLTGRKTRGALWYIDDERDVVIDVPSPAAAVAQSETTETRR